MCSYLSTPSPPSQPLIPKIPLNRISLSSHFRKSVLPRRSQLTHISLHRRCSSHYPPTIMVSMWLPPPAALLAPEMNVLPHPHHPQSFILNPALQAEMSLPAIYPPSPQPKSIPSSTASSPITKLSSPRSIKKQFPCPYPGCAQTSSNKGNLSKHIATRHEHRKDFACPFKGCNRRFAKKYNMLRHLSASGVHRGKSVRSVKGRRFSDRAKWTSMELDLANFLAMQCQPTVVGAV